MTKKNKGNQGMVYFIAAIAALAGLLFGYDTGVISGAILYISQDFHLSTHVKELVVGSVLFGALLGSLSSGRVSDLFGRRLVMMATAITFIFGSLITALAPNPEVLIVGRVVLGVAIGIASFTAPLYLSEIAPFHIRGALVSLNQLMITIGILASYIVNYSFANAGMSWRWMLGAGVVPAFILLIGMVFLPQSPRWMVLRGFVNEAKDILVRIRGNEQDAQTEIHAIQHSMQRKHESWRMVFTSWIRPVLIIGIVLNFFQQATGINTIIYYAPTVFKMAGFESNVTAIMATMGIGTINVLFTIIALPLIDRVGRRPLLLFGLTGMTLSLFALGWAFHNQADMEMLPWIAMSSMLVYIACFAISLGPIVWLIIAEIYPLRVRGFGMSLATTANWTFNMIVALTFLTLIDMLGAGHTFWLFAATSVLGWLFVYFKVPETKGVTLEQIEYNLRLGKSTRELGRPVQSTTLRPQGNY